MSTKYSNIIPANANIEIEYGKTDKVKFSYPIEWSYTKAVIHRAFPTIFTFFMLAFVKFLSLLMWVILIPIMCFISIMKYVDIVFYDNLIYSIAKTNIYIFNNSDIIINVMFIFVLFCLIFPFIISLNKKLLSNLMPKFGYYTIALYGRTKEKIFITTEVENNKCVIPNFNNVFLNYKATEDFSMYLKKVKISAYDFKFNIKQRIGIFIHRKLQKNDYVYYAIFEFSKTPINGYLECEYY